MKIAAEEREALLTVGWTEDGIRWLAEHGLLERAVEDAHRIAERAEASRPS